VTTGRREGEEATASREWVARAALVAVAALSIALIALLARPFAGALFLAGVLAGVLYPWSERLSRRLGGRRALAAGIVTLGVLLTVVIPVALLAGVMVREAVHAADLVRQTLQSGGVEELRLRLPAPLQAAFGWIEVRLPLVGPQLQSLLTAQGPRAAAAVTGALAATTNAFVQVVMMLVALLFLLQDGPLLVAWAISLSPLRPGQLESLLEEFRRVSIAVGVSSVATAGAQGLAALIGYLIARAPEPLFFAVLTFVVGLIPFLSPTIVSLGVTLLLLMNGHTFPALFLLVWSLGAVGLVDNFIRPLVLRTGTRIHGAVLLFALLGGLAVFGPLGIVAGPIIVTFFLAMMRICRREFGGDEGAGVGEPGG